MTVAQAIIIIVLVLILLVVLGLIVVPWHDHR